VSDEYAVEPNLGSGIVHYRLESPFLVVEHEKEGVPNESVLLEEVTSVRLGLVQGMAFCTLATASGQKVTISSRHVRGFGDFVDQLDEYSDFVRSLHYELADAAPKARYVAGSNLMFALSVLVLGMAALAAIVVTVALVAKGGASLGSFLPALGVTPIAIGMSFVLVRQGRAKPYDPASPPDAFLPSSLPG
jgi:hypothetical protein